MNQDKYELLKVYENALMETLAEKLTKEELMSILLETKQKFISKI